MLWFRQQRLGRHTGRMAGALVGLLALLGARPAAAQTPVNTGTITGIVRAAQTGVALPYAVLVISATGLERFSGADGRYVLTPVPAGTYQLQVRRIGFVPQSLTVTVSPGATTTLDIVLLQVPVRLTALVVRPVEPCTAPGLPDAIREPGVATLVNLLRDNAATYRTLVEQHPYAYAIYRGLGTTGGDTARISSVVAERIEGVRAVRYQPGKVVVTERFQSRMQLPTILDLTDPTFIRNHCFHYRGTSAREGETWFALEVRAAERLKNPDVHGIFWLDSASAQLRRMELELSRPDRLPRALRSIQAVVVSTTFLEIAPGLAIPDDICAVNVLRPTRGPRPHPLELQHVQAVAFLQSPPPDVPPQRAFPNPSWIAGGRLGLDRLPCQGLSP